MRYLKRYSHREFKDAVKPRERKAVASIANSEWRLALSAIPAAVYVPTRKRASDIKSFRREAVPAEYVSAAATSLE